MKGVQKGVVTAKLSSCIMININKVKRQHSVNELDINLDRVERQLNNTAEMLKWRSKANIKIQIGLTFQINSCV